jgi:hypothetical protein
VPRFENPVIQLEIRKRRVRTLVRRRRRPRLARQDVQHQCGRASGERMGATIAVGLPSKYVVSKELTPCA